MTSMKTLSVIQLAVLSTSIGILPSPAASLNDFIIDEALMPGSEFFLAACQKNGIPSFDNPVFVQAS